MTKVQPQTDASLRDALDRAGAEAHGIAQGMGRIDAALGAMVQVTHLSTETLQIADLLRQEVEGLATFLTRLARQTDAAISCDAALATQQLSLRAQAWRLSGRDQPPEAPPTDDIWMDVGT